MPRYDVDGRVANISEESVNEFLKRYPAAKLIENTPYYLTRTNEPEKPKEEAPNDYMRPLRAPAIEQPRVEFSKPEELFRPRSGQEIVRDNLRNKPVDPALMFDAQIEQYQRERDEIKAIQDNPDISPEEKKAALDYYNTYVRPGGPAVDNLPASALSWLDRNKIEYDVPMYNPSIMGGGVSAYKSKKQNTPEQEELIRDFISNTPEGQRFVEEHKAQLESLDKAIDDLKAKIEDSERDSRKVARSVYMPGSPMFGGGRYVEVEAPENYKDIEAARAQLLELERLREAYNDRTLSQIKQFGRELGRRAGEAAINTATLGTSRLLMNAGLNKTLQDPDNELTREASDLLAQYQAVHTADRSIAQDIARATTDNADFIAQFAATGGIASALTKGAATAIGKKLGGNMFAKAVGKMGEDMAGAFVRTSLMPSTLATAYEINSREPGSFLNAYSNAFLQNFIENYTESLGAHFPTRFKFLGKESSWANKVGKYTGFQGVLPEFAEEQFATIFHSAAGDGQAQWSDLIDPRNQMVTLGTVGVMQLPYTTINAGGYAAGKFHNVQQKRSVTKGYQSNLKNMGIQFGRDMGGVVDFINEKIQENPETSMPALIAIAEQESEMTDKQKDAFIKYGLSYLAYSGLNKAKTEEIVETAQGVATLLEDNINPKTGSIMTAVLAGLDSPVQIMDGRIVVREDGSIDREKSDQQIFYEDPEGNRKVTSINLVESMAESIPVQEAIRLATEQVTASIVTQQENEEVRPYEVGEVVRVTVDGANIIGQIAGIDETTGNYVLSAETPNGIMQVPIEPRQIVNEDNIQGVENGSTVSYLDANDNVIEGVVEDIYSQRANGIAFIDGEAIPIANIIAPASEVKEQSAPQDSTGEAVSVRQPQEWEELSEVPMDAEGSPDFNAMSPIMLGSQIEQLTGSRDASYEMLTAMLEENKREQQKQMEKLPKKASDLNKFASERKRLQNEGLRLERALSQYSDISEARANQSEMDAIRKENAGPDMDKLSNREFIRQAYPDGAPNLYMQVLFDIINGQRFVWENNGNTRGIAEELGKTGENGHRRSYIGILASPENGGDYFDDYVHAIYTDGGWDLSDAEIRDIVIEALNDAPSPGEAAKRVKDIYRKTDINKNELADYYEDRAAYLEENPGPAEIKEEANVDENSDDYVPFQSMPEDQLNVVNGKFNEELQQQIEGKLPKGHVYQLGTPSAVLQSAGIPNLPIEMASARLQHKSNQKNHPFGLSEVENLPQAIHRPLAVFRSATHIGSNVILTELQQNGKNFVVAIETNKNSGRIRVNSIRSIHPRTTSNIINWIDEGLMDYADKERMTKWMADKKKMSRSTFGSTPANAVKQLNSIAKIINDFENPKLHRTRSHFKAIGNKKFKSLINKLKKSGLAKEVVTDKAQYDAKLGKVLDGNGVVMRNKAGDIYGFVADGVVYLNSSRMNANTPIHEFGHLWNSFIKENNPELWARGAELVRESEYWQRVNDNPAYSKLTDEQKVDEALAMAIGDKGEAIVNQSLKERFADWLKEVWDSIKEALGINADISIEDMTLGDFTDLAVGEILSGKDLQKSSGNAIFVNENNSENGKGTETGLDHRRTVGRNTLRRLVGESAQGQRIAEAAEAGYGWRDGRATEESLSERWDKNRFLGRLEVVARKNGSWIDDISSVANVNKKLNGGYESEVYEGIDGENVIKLNNLNFLNDNDTQYERTRDFDYFIERIAAHNELFPTDIYEIIGYAENSLGQVSVVMFQPFVEDAELATNEQVDEFLQNYGFRKANLSGVEGMSGYTNGRYELSDIKPQNVLVDKEGNLRFIDLDITLAPENDQISKQEVSEMEQIKQRSIEDGTFMKAPNGEPTNLTERQWLQVRTSNFKNWFGDWENDPESASKVVDSNGEPLVVYHGTTHQFYEFTKDKGNVENHFGIAYYFTDSLYDVESNYLSEGADLTNRIERLAERIQDEEEVDYEEAEERAERELRGGEEIILDVFLNIKYPMDVRPDGTRFDALEIYDEESDEYIENEGSLPMELYNALNNIQYNFDEIDAQSIWDELSEVIGFEWDGVSAYDIDKALRGIESIAYLDDGNGNLISHEFIRALYDEMGFDGIIMDADRAFGNQRDSGRPMEMDNGTSHYIAFNPNQIKSATANTGEFSKDTDDIRFQSVDDVAELTGSTMTEEMRKELDVKLKNFAFRLREAWEDKHLAVKNFLDTLRENGTEVAEHNDFYKQATHLNGKIDAQLERYNNQYQKPLNEAIRNLGDAGFEERDIENYVILKHGLERNEWMRQDAVDKYKETHPDATPEQIERYEDSLPWDYSGISAVQTEVGMTAEDFIEQFEQKAGEGLVDNLWKRTKDATAYALNKQLEGGLIDKKTLDELNARYEYYVPLRGHDAETAEDRWDYSPNMGTYFVAPLIKAKGRKTRSESPFAYVASMAQSAINSANRNILNQTILRLARKDKTGLMSVNKAWYMEVGSSDGIPTFEIQSPTYSEDPEQYRKNIEEFEARMEKLAESGMAFQSGKRLNIGRLFIKRSQAEQHEVHIYQNGVEYVVYINANPAVARAINGANMKDLHKDLQFFAKVSRQMAANFTTRNPVFVLSNFSRDYIFASSILPVKEDVKYALQFQKNMPISADALQRYVRGKADLSKKQDRYLNEYILNGAKTGFSHIVELQKVQKQIERDIKRGRSKGAMDYTIRPVLDTLAAMNDVAENMSRLSVYITSREQGRSIAQSVSDAKEVTVNFNRSGAGGMGSQWVRPLYLFVNAGIQALSNFAKASAKHPGRAAALISSYVASGFLMPFISSLFGGDDGLDEYMKLGDWERQNNLCIYTGAGFIKIPLPHELRVFHKMGDEIYQSIFGKKDVTETLLDVALGFSDLIPANPLGAITGSWADIMPDATKPFFQLAANKSFTGSYITNEWADPKKPGYLRIRTNKKGEAYAPSFLVKLAEGLDSATGGDGVEKGVISLNPDVMNHIMRGYFGGLYTITMQGLDAASKTYDWASTGELNLKVRETPLRTFYTSSDDLQTASSGLNSRYFKIADEVKETLRKEKGYREQVKDGKMGVPDYIQKTQKLNIAKANELNDWLKRIKKYENELKELEGEEQKELERVIANLKGQVVELNNQE